MNDAIPSQPESDRDAYLHCLDKGGVDLCINSASGGLYHR